MNYAIIVVAMVWNVISWLLLASLDRNSMRFMIQKWFWKKKCSWMFILFFMCSWNFLVWFWFCEIAMVFGVCDLFWQLCQIGSKSLL